MCLVATLYFAVRLRCSGVHPDEHSVKSELVSVIIIVVLLLDQLTTDTNIGRPHPQN